jgi:hypothetical protein
MTKFEDNPRGNLSTGEKKKKKFLLNLLRSLSDYIYINNITCRIRALLHIWLRARAN